MKRLLLLIVVIAAILRLWQLGNVPPSPDWDEVALGYNAYSIMLTEKDEYGTSFPIVLRSFDDYKPALYTYLAIPFIKAFGLNVFATRLPSVVFGVLTVLATYFLVNELFKKEKIALLAAFLLSISPWHLQFSRIAFESNVGLSLNIFAMFFFLKGLKKPWYLMLSSFFAGLSLHAYQSEKVFLPIIFFALFVIFKKEILSTKRKYIICSLVVGLVITLPLVWYLATQSQAFLRAKGVSIFADQTPFLKATVARLAQDANRNDILGLVLDNRRVTYVYTAISGYISHFDINWWFLSGDQPRHHAPNMSLLYLWELPFVFIGIYSLLFRPTSGEFDKKVKLLIFAWFLIAPIPASITTGVPHPIRTLNFLPTFQIFVALGIFTFISFISNMRMKYLILSLYLMFSIFNFLYYLNQYFVQLNFFTSENWQYGYKEAIAEIKRIEPNYDKIIVTNKPHLDQSYMFFLFYTQYDPKKYQEHGGTVSGGFAVEHKGFSKFTFRPIDWDKEEKNPRVLYVGRPDDFPQDAKIIKTINFLDGKPAIKIVEG